MMSDECKQTVHSAEPVVRAAEEEVKAIRDDSGVELEIERPELDGITVDPEADVAPFELYMATTESFTVFKKEEERQSNMCGWLEERFPGFPPALKYYLIHHLGEISSQKQV